jgi:hypothetical protein
MMERTLNPKKIKSEEEQIMHAYLSKSNPLKSTE